MIFLLIAIAVFGYHYFFNRQESFITPLKVKEKPLNAYTFENLKKTKFPKSAIEIGRNVGETDEYFSQMFYYPVPQTPGGSVMKKVSGLMNIPKKSGVYPIVVMFRGYAPLETYRSGIGTQPFAAALAKHGFITLAPDFLGYGESDSAAKDAFEDRFQTYTTALALLSSLSTLNSGLEASYSGTIKADTAKIGIWGHSNGGHVALAALAVSGVSYPTVLWAPVSKSFPYSILYYTDEFDDQGKALRKALAKFEVDYDTELFSPFNYYRWIKAPLEINQGEADQEVPLWWSDDFVAALKKFGIDVKYLTYPGADHNLLPSAWSSAATNSIVFYDEYCNKQ